MTNIQKCGVIGVGFVGATCAYTLAVSGLFSDLVLVDMNRGKAIGEASDINHGVAFSKPCRVTAGDYADLAECGLIIIAARRKPETGRKPFGVAPDAIKASCPPSLHSLRQSIVEAILLVVSNPVDVLTCLAAAVERASLPDVCSVPVPCWILRGSSTYLLGQRQAWTAAMCMRLSSASTATASWRYGRALTSPVLIWTITAALQVSPSLQTSFPAFTSMCAMRLTRIIDSKGATYYGIGMAVRRIAEAIVRNEHSVLPVTSMIHGHLRRGRYLLCVPTIVGRNGAEAVLDIPLLRGRTGNSCSVPRTQCAR